MHLHEYKHTKQVMHSLSESHSIVFKIAKSFTQVWPSSENGSLKLDDLRCVVQRNYTYDGCCTRLQYNLEFTQDAM